ncbi:MAG: class I SAM-dependent methyltransferase [Candidatus Margulisiibacteriota bacterium]
MKIYHENSEEPAGAGFYDRALSGNSVRKFWHLFKFEAAFSCVPQGAERILDLGCSAGTFIGHFLCRLKPKRLAGVDVNADSIKLASSKYGKPGVEFFKGKLSGQNFPDGSFDAITCLEVLEHLNEDEALSTLRKANDLLSASGCLIITTPDYDSHWRFIEVLLDLVSRQNYIKQHVNRFNKKKLVRLLNKAGFKIKTCSNILGFSPFIALVNMRMAQTIFKKERWGALILCVAEKAD